MGGHLQKPLFFPDFEMVDGRPFVRVAKSLDSTYALLGIPRTKERELKHTDIIEQILKARTLAYDQFLKGEQAVVPMELDQDSPRKRRKCKQPAAVTDAIPKVLHISMLEIQGVPGISMNVLSGHKTPTLQIELNANVVKYLQEVATKQLAAGTITRTRESSNTDTSEYSNICWSEARQKFRVTYDGDDGLKKYKYVGEKGDKSALPLAVETLKTLSESRAWAGFK